MAAVDGTGLVFERFGVVCVGSKEAREKWEAKE